ncbi:MAG TPA: hypothetical protein DCZ94_08590 [Lentisphaeria bacterium]|nr:MAG: hypothetical protein A2X48_12360 [Lentisphaerae bacterium GWF2_49_21]HBC86996.1 hypothetical protein [Lentisphaeria bacterium]
MTLKKISSGLFVTFILISFSVYGQDSANNPSATPGGRTVSAAQISVQITKKNWEKVREYGIAAAVPLIASLRDDDDEIRAVSAEILGSLGDKRAVAPLIECLMDKDWHVRQQSAKALGILKDKKTIDPLVGCLNDSSRDVRLEAVGALKSIADERAFHPLVKSLKDSDPSVRSEAIKALIMTGGENSVEPFLEYLKDPNSESKVEVIRALGVLGDKKAVGQLILLLKSKDKTVRMWAAVVLGRIGDSRAVEPLKEALNDSDPKVKWKAEESLKKLNVNIKPVETAKPQIAKKPEPPASPAVPDTPRAQPDAKPQETPVEKAGETVAGNKIPPSEAKKKGTVHWWIVGIVGIFAGILILLGLVRFFAGKKSPGEIKKELDRLAAQIREVCTRKSGDSMQNFALSLLESQSVAYMLFPTHEGTAEEKRKCLATMKETNKKVSDILGAFHKGVLLLNKMCYLIERNLDVLADALHKQPGVSDKGVLRGGELPTESFLSSGVNFKRQLQNENGIYEIYTANSKDEAIEFLRKTTVKMEKKYVIVETPVGNFGKDLIAIFNEGNGSVIEYGKREPLPQRLKSPTHCVKCGYPVLPAGSEIDESVEKLLFEESAPAQGIMALKKEGNKWLIMEQLKKHGVGLSCKKCPTAWCPFCVDPSTPDTCGICKGEMTICRGK